MKTFSADAFRQQLQAHDWTLAHCARALNVPVTSVSGWANGRHRPAWGNVQRLAHLLAIDPEDLLTDVTAFTPGTTGAVGLSEAQALILAVAVALVRQPDPETLAADWLHQLLPADLDALRQRLVITPRWHWAWEQLQRLGAVDHPLAPYTVQVRMTPPAPRRRAR